MLALKSTPELRVSSRSLLAAYQLLALLGVRMKQEGQAGHSWCLLRQSQGEMSQAFPKARRAAIQSQTQRWHGAHSELGSVTSWVGPTAFVNVCT